MFWNRMAASAVSEIRGDEVLRRLQAGERLTLVDVREPHEFAAGHIPGAKLIPLGQIQARLEELDPAQEIIVVCRTGHRSGAACRILAKNGFDKAKNLIGGMVQWRGPVSSGIRA